MFLRVVQFFTCQLVWEDRAKVGSLEILLGMQFLEWYENLAVSSNLLSKELHMISTIWNFIFENGKLSSEELSFHPKRKQFRETINKSKSTFGHLTFQHYRSECRRDTFLNYIVNHLVSQREIQRRNQNHQSHFKRSSDHSNSTRGNTSFGRYPTPRVKDIDPQELLELLELSPKERKIILSK